MSTNPRHLGLRPIALSSLADELEEHDVIRGSRLRGPVVREAVERPSEPEALSKAPAAGVTVTEPDPEPTKHCWRGDHDVPESGFQRSRNGGLFAICRGCMAELMRCGKTGRKFRMPGHRGTDELPELGPAVVVEKSVEAGGGEPAAVSSEREVEPVESEVARPVDAVAVMDRLLAAEPDPAAEPEPESAPEELVVDWRPIGHRPHPLAEQTMFEVRAGQYFDLLLEVARHSPQSPFDVQSSILDRIEKLLDTLRSREEL